jgi:hypothetical protein
MSPQSIEIDKAIDGAQHVSGRNVVVQPKLIEQALLPNQLIAHHDGASRFILSRMNQQQLTTTTDEFFNDICQ